MKISITIDAEEDYGAKTYEGIRKGIPKLISILDKNKAKATFFVTAGALKKNKILFRKISAKKHEIALHGYEHERWDELNFHEKADRIEKAIKNYRKIMRENPKGFRAPQFSSDFTLIELLDAEKFVYDSSIVQTPLSQLIFFPSKIKLYWNQRKFIKKIRKGNLKIKEIPVSSFFFPVSMFSLRILPFWLFRLNLSLSLFFRRNKEIIFLAHSYEFNDKLLMKFDKIVNIIKEKYKVKSSDFITLENLAR